MKTPLAFAACAVWLTATAALAQPQPPVQTPPAQNPPVQEKAAPTPVSPLIVQERPGPAVLQKQARGYVESYAAPTRKLGQFARWFDPACVLVTGLIPEQAAQFRTRIEQVARTVRAPMAPAGCSPNVQIAFSTEPQKTLDSIVARAPTALGYDGDKTVTRPIQAWYTTATLGQPPERGRELNTQGAVIDTLNSKLAFDSTSERFRDKLGAMPNSHFFAEGRRCIDSSNLTCPHAGFLNVLIIVDAAHMGDVSVDLTSDYLAMLTLSQPQPRSQDGCMVLPSVMDLYAKACPDREAPTGLTAADTAFLASLYAADLTVDKTREQSDIAGRMVKILTPAKAPAR